MSKLQELEALVKQQKEALEAMASGLVVKKTVKDGLYIKDDSFREFSTNKIEKLRKEEQDKKDKNPSYVMKEIKDDDERGWYTACINIPKNSALSILGNPSRLDKIVTLGKQAMGIK